MLELNEQNMTIKSAKPGKGDSTAWEVVFAGEIDDGQCNDLYNDPKFSSRVWDRSGNDVQIGEAWRRVKKIPCSDKYEGLETELEMGGATFQFPESRLSNISFVPNMNSTAGIVHFKMQLQPQNDKAILQLCHHKNGPVKLSFSGGSLVLARGEQQSLPLDADQAKAEDKDAGKRTRKKAAPRKRSTRKH